MKNEGIDVMYKDCELRGAWLEGECVESTTDLKDPRIRFYSLYLVRAVGFGSDWIADFGDRLHEAKIVREHFSDVIKCTYDIVLFGKITWR